VHPIQTGRDRVPRIEVIPNSAAHVQGKGKILPLGVQDTEGLFRVNVSEAHSSVEVRSKSSAARDEIPSKTDDPGKIASFWSAGNKSDSPAALKVPIAAKNPRAAHVINLPAERANDGDQSVFVLVIRIPITYTLAHTLWPDTAKSCSIDP